MTPYSPMMVRSIANNPKAPERNAMVRSCTTPLWMLLRNIRNSASIPGLNCATLACAAETISEEDEQWRKTYVADSPSGNWDTAPNVSGGGFFLSARYPFCFFLFFV